MNRYEEALEFLSDPEKVTFYTDEERASAPCPICGAEGNAPCTWSYRPKRKARGELRTEVHEERVALRMPRGIEGMADKIEELARRYARGVYPHPMASYGPAKYQQIRFPWEAK